MIEKHSSGRYGRRRTRSLSVWDLDGSSIAEVCAFLEESAAGLTDPILNFEHAYEEIEASVSGWELLSDEKDKEHRAKLRQIAKNARKLAENNRRLNEAAQVERELKMLKELKDKYPDAAL